MSKHLPIVTGLALLLGLAAAALITTELYGPAQEQRVTGVGGPLFVSNRTARSLCYQGVGYQGVGGQAVTADHRDLLDQGVDLLDVQLAAHLYPTVEVSSGCPDPAAADASKRFHDPKTGKITALGPTTETPSEYLVHLYIVEPDLYRDWFGDQPWTNTSEEMWCGSPRTFTCAPVTYGIYVTPSATADTFLRSMFDAFGLVPSLEERAAATPTE